LRERSARLGQSSLSHRQVHMLGLRWSWRLSLVRPHFGHVECTSMIVPLRFLCIQQVCTKRGNANAPLPPPAMAGPVRACQGMRMEFSTLGTAKDLSAW
jgi:hypothetical protein